jgi:uncharacterized protein (TIGR02588 family)
MTRDAPGISRWEWAAAFVASALVLAVIGALLVDARKERTPPDLTVTVDRVTAEQSTFLVQFTVTNHGGMTAAEVIVEGELRTEGKPERSEATFDYVPGQSKRRGGLFFTTDPAKGALTLRPLGYREP